jgi:hypothetical protein
VFFGSRADFVEILLNMRNEMLSLQDLIRSRLVLQRHLDNFDHSLSHIRMKLSYESNFCLNYFQKASTALAKDQKNPDANEFNIKRDSVTGVYTNFYETLNAWSEDVKFVEQLAYCQRKFSRNSGMEHKMMKF